MVAPPEILGSGSSCYVITVGDEVAVKSYEVWQGDRRVIKRDPCEDQIQREAAIYRHLGAHPYIAKFLGMDKTPGGASALLLEAAPLQCVRKYIVRNPDSTPSLQIRLRMALDMAKGLQYLHSMGVIHCDLSTRNLLLFDNVDFRVKLCDFGVSLYDGYKGGQKIEPDGAYESRYTLPLRGREYLDVPIIACELFAMGMAVYELSEWVMPFQQLGQEEVELKYAREEFPPLDNSPVRHIITRCWTEQYSTAVEVVRDLELCQIPVWQ